MCTCPLLLQSDAKEEQGEEEGEGEFPYGLSTATLTVGGLTLATLVSLAILVASLCWLKRRRARRTREQFKKRLFATPSGSSETLYGRKLV